MSLPIPSTLIVQGATSLAGEVARRISQAVGFADVLESGSDAPTESESPQALQEKLTLQENLIASAERLIRQSGLDLNQPLSLRVEPDGQLRISPEHSQSAEIESLLRGDQTVRELADRLAAVSGSHPIDLTIPAATASILPVPGGYPNW